MWPILRNKSVEQSCPWRSETCLLWKDCLSAYKPGSKVRKEQLSFLVSPAPAPPCLPPSHLLALWSLHYLGLPCLYILTILGSCYIQKFPSNCIDEKYLKKRRKTIREKWTWGIEKERRNSCNWPSLVNIINQVVAFSLLRILSIISSYCSTDLRKF